ncbi:SHOCT domain-containing protein [Peristeroidobacter agariperforans]|uniref:SHOCT domain-containing protein n=1 Tax=Peristeroidobacter agariperforans TaxID=268404 RepID=UPI0038997F7E
MRAPPPAASSSNHQGSDLVASLRELAEMKASGALTEKEYTAAKARVLDGG